MNRSSNCARLHPLRILARKWSYLVLRSLRSPSGFSKIQKELRFITNRILSRELALLQEEGLITSDEGVYSVTEAGADLVESTEALADWSEKHRELVKCPSEQKCNMCSGYPVAIGERHYKS